MKTIELTFVDRVKLATVLGEARGPVSKIAALQPVYEAIRFSEDELKQIESQEIGAGQWSYKAADPEALRKSVVLEDAQAAVIRRELDEWPGCTIADLEWMERVKKALTAPVKMPSMPFRNRKKRMQQ